MCGIVGIFNVKNPTPELRQRALRMSQKIRHRGPDWSGIYVGRSATLCHERLSIVDPESGRQPLFSPDRRQVLAVNGEIYNHKRLREQLAADYDFQTGSDCEVILALYRQWKAQGSRPEALPTMIEALSGIFAFALYDEDDDAWLVARDAIGVIPLYIGRDADGTAYVASELKALEGQCDAYEPFQPGHYLWSRDAEATPKCWYTRPWMQGHTIAPAELTYGQATEEVRQSLMTAVRRQLMSDVPYGVLLSGGLDSSVISAVAKRYADRRIESDGQTQAWWPRLHSFAVGLRGAPDLAKARLVAEHIGTVHHEINYTIEEGLDALRDVIYFIETYDVTTVVREL